MTSPNIMKACILYKQRFRRLWHGKQNQKVQISRLFCHFNSGAAGLHLSHHFANKKHVYEKHLA